MLSAVTLSRSPPRADTTMMATRDRSRIWRHSSNPSASGSIRSSRTMSGSWVSSSLSTRMPSWDTTVSNPRTARLDRIRSTMLGSSSTTRTRVLAVGSGIVLLSGGGGASGYQYQRPGTGLARIIRQVGGQAHPEPGAPGQPVQFDPALVGLGDALGDGQAEPGPAGPGPAPAARLERGRGHLVGDAGAVVGDADHDLGPGRLGGDPDLGPGRVVPDRVVDEVDEDLFQPVVVGPDDRQARIALDVDRGRAGRRPGGP